MIPMLIPDRNNWEMMGILLRISSKPVVIHLPTNNPLRLNILVVDKIQKSKVQENLAMIPPSPKGKEPREKPPPSQNSYKQHKSWDSTLLGFKVRQTSRDD